MALSYSEISAITHKRIYPVLVDNIFTSNVLLQRAKKKGWYERKDGGEKILAPIAYATTTASGWYSGADTLNTSANDQITSLEFDWKQIYANVTVTRLDELKNSGDAAVINFVKSKMQIAEKTLADAIGTGLYNAGTTANAIIGLRLAVSDSGTYGGVSRTTYSWLAAQEDSSTTVFSLPAMQALYGDCTQGSSKPTVICTTQDIFDSWMNSLQPQQRFIDKQSADAGFQNISWNGTAVLADNHCPASHVFFLNEDYLHLCVHTKEDFRMEPFQKPIDQNVSTAKIYWTGALFCNNPRMQGKADAIA